MNNAKNQKGEFVVLPYGLWNSFMNLREVCIRVQTQSYAIDKKKNEIKELLNQSSPAIQEILNSLDDAQEKLKASFHDIKTEYQAQVKKVLDIIKQAGDKPVIYRLLPVLGSPVYRTQTFTAQGDDVIVSESDEPLWN